MLHKSLFFSLADENYFLLDSLDQLNFDTADEARSVDQIVYKLVFKDKNIINTYEVKLDRKRNIFLFFFFFLFSYLLLGILSFQEIIQNDKQNILLLCQWATSKQRHGFHRAIICSEVLRMRHAHTIELVNKFFP